ncbi:hypothetical protein FN976_25140 [Caenimonas sedimenti]|uniref:YfhO family protein n=1 Tax=Caenimonas sedimenti TaxID=2596921 RepID=A0A562ZHS0_9BURK|nr:hypothetical protein [Caenimonas sedimenti]TWO67917.1 hypothetical protein FN976_25140 [Caenimonas sedimenti]
MTRWLPRLCIALPAASLALALLAWLRFGIDMPWYDDWRTYDGGWAGSLAPRHLFQAINYTLSPIGIGLDALAQRLLDGNAIAYQFLSMLAVLGGLLLLQWNLLLAALGDRSKAALCFVFTLPMLQPGSYWGQENLAYHQALPLLFTGAALWLVLRGDLLARWRGPLLAALALLAGLSYISGAFGSLAAGAALLALAAIQPAGQRRGLARDAAWFTAGALLATLAQFQFAFLSHQGTTAAVPLAMPWHGAFWWYALGKVARALMLPPDHAGLALGVTLAMLAVAVAAAAWLVQGARSGGHAPRQRVATVFLALAAMLAVYLGLVAAGRAHLRPGDVQAPLEVFRHAFPRFHFFWLTLLWPWLAAAVLSWPRLPQRGRAVAALVFMGLAVTLGAFAHMPAQRERAEERAAALQCLRQELQKAVPVRCPGLLPPNRTEAAPDALPAYTYATRIGSSFVRTLAVEPASERAALAPALFDLQAGVGTLELHQLRRSGTAFEALGDDPQLFLNLVPREAAARCTAMEVVMQVQALAPGTARLFWGDPAFIGPFHENASQTRTVRGGAPEMVAFRIASPRGFFHSFRLDPVEGRQPLRIERLRAVCVSAREPAPAGR